MGIRKPKHPTSCKNKPEYDYWVETSAYTYNEYIDHWIADSYTIFDMIDIRACCKRHAIKKGVKKMLLKSGYGSDFQYCTDRKMDNLCPYTGVRAYRTYECKVTEAIYEDKMIA